MDPVVHAVKRQALREATAENSARHAAVFGFVDTTGWGEFDIPDEITFDLSFVEEPNVAYGYACIADDQGAGDLTDTRYPRGWGFVTKWTISDRGLYTGCFVSLIVDTMGAEQVAPSASEPGYIIRHSFTFTAVALKDIGASAADS